MAAIDREEHYILRVQDRNLADRIKGLLRGTSTSELEAAGFQILFNGELTAFHTIWMRFQLTDLPVLTDSRRSRPHGKDQLSERGVSVHAVRPAHRGGKLQDIQRRGSRQEQ